MMLYLSGKQTEADVTVEELEAITLQYPYFGAAKFLLAKKAQSNNHAGFDGFAQSAVVHFANPYWFHFKLNEEHLMDDKSALFSEIKPGDLPEDKVEPVISTDAEGAINAMNLVVVRLEASDYAQVKEDIEKNIIIPVDDFQSIGNEDVSANSENISSSKNTLENNIEDAGQTEISQADADYEKLEEAVATEVESNVQDLEEDILSAKEEKEQNADDIVPAVSLEDVPIDKDDVVPAVEIDNDDTKEEDDIVPAIEVAEETGETDDIFPAIEQEESPAQIDTASAIAEDEHPESSSLHIPGTVEDADTEYADNEKNTDADEETGSTGEFGPANNKISAVLQDQLQEFKKPVAADAPVPIETEPYHTVDYFASQGIKLSLDQQKQDNLGVKVRKFTDWLKQMKRVNPTPVDLGIDEAAEHKVQSIAASSNEVKEVVTEAMAEVLAMQGMNDKAIQVYKKLSFLEPTKSAYFATKIETLKG